MLLTVDCEVALIRGGTVPLFFLLLLIIISVDKIILFITQIVFLLVGFGDGIPPLEAFIFFQICKHGNIPRVPCEHELFQICNHGNVLRAPCEYDPQDRRNANRGLAGTGWPPFGEYKVVTVMIMIVVMINTTNCYYLA